jgi:hypothetical protein
MLLRLTFPVSLADVAKIEGALEKAAGGYSEHLADQQHELHMNYSDQDRFVRNMAVVALASRLAHGLYARWQDLQRPLVLERSGMEELIRVSSSASGRNTPRDSA